MTHLVQTARIMANVPLYHWGDIDAGGVRIAAHLEDAFGVQIFLHDMHPALASAHGQHWGFGSLALQRRSKVARTGGAQPQSAKLSDAKAEPRMTEATYADDKN
jgi:hypothetical protein